VKVSLAEVRSLIREVLLNGVQEHQFRTATSDYVDAIRQLLRRHILLDKSRTPTDRQRAFNVATKVLRELEDEVSDLLDAKLEKFSSNA
jgi:hypothetical protein